jgi:hypothetical protein
MGRVGGRAVGRSGGEGWEGGREEGKLWFCTCCCIAFLIDECLTMAARKEDESAVIRVL